MKNKWKYGDINKKTGLVFKSYDKRYKKGETWITLEQYERYRKNNILRSKENYKTDDYRKKRKKYTQNPLYKYKRNEHNKKKYREDSNYRSSQTNIKKVKKWDRTLIFSAVKSAKKRNQICDIDIEWVQKKYKEQNGLCFWFGIEMIPSIIPNHPQQPSLDRLDNAIGYTKDNTVLCCLFANLGRKNSSKEIMIDFVSKIKKKTTLKKKIG